MDKSVLQKGLASFSEKLDSQTYIGTYRETSRASLLNYDNLSTRANSIWKMAQYVIAYYDNNPNKTSKDYIKGWRILTRNYQNQFLFLGIDHNQWEMYDARGTLLGGNEYISDYIAKQAPTNRSSDKPLQLIYYGAPGTSKSTTIKKEIGNAPQHRITFHPDTDYSSFVGCYKPTKESGTKEITYKFVAQTFVKAYVEAWKTLVSDKEDKRVYLIIEEINRGNCAQIFGDLFQLLDRDDYGFSDYTIEPDTDLQRYLAEEAFKESTNIPNEIRNGSLLRLPPNLFIWATMNTSDQSLFPIDSAFKRRWEWKYLPIKNDNKSHIIRVDKKRAYKWWDFVDAINKRIEKLTEQEDKQIGYWFAKPNEGLEISIDRFVSKVVFYLWNDVFKDFAKDANSPFVIKDSQNNRHELKFSMFFDDAGNAIPDAVAVFIEGLKVPRIPTPEQPQTPANDGDKTINTPDENNSVEGAELTEEEREIEEYNETFETDTTENTETIPTNDVEAELDFDAENEDGASIGKTDVDDFLKTLYKK